MASETFSPTFSQHPDFEGGANWSAGIVPGSGTAALINAIDAWVEPLADITANVTLEGGAALIGNQSGFELSGTLLALDANALYGNGAIVNQGEISILGNLASLNIVVQAGNDIARDYGLTIPSFENAGIINVDNGATLNICGTEFSNIGTVNIDDAILSVSGGWVDGGQETGQSALTRGGIIELSNGGIASFTDGVADQIFDFSGPGTISLADPSDVQNIAITNFGYRDEILTTSVTAANTLLASRLFFTTPLPAGDTFAVRATASGAEILLENDNTPPCFAQGTGILTPTGYVPIEHLAPGALVITAAGAQRPIKWIGWRGIELTRHPRPEAVRPVRINAGALGLGIPSRNLTLSPDHALFLHGHLIPVKLLVNGVTIRRETDCRSVSYFHLELDRHDIILAENTTVETYLDTGNRNAFSNSHGQPHASPVFGRGKQWDASAFADLCIAGPVLSSVRQEIFKRTHAAGYRIETDFRIDIFHGDQKIVAHDAPVYAVTFQLLPHQNGPIAIRSASFVPAEFDDGAEPEDDWRHLGLAIACVKLDDTQTTLGRIATRGVHPRGIGDDAEWTDGHAVIDVPTGTKTISLALQAFPKRWVLC